MKSKSLAASFNHSKIAPTARFRSQPSPAVRCRWRDHRVVHWVRYFLGSVKCSKFSRGTWRLRESWFWSHRGDVFWQNFWMCAKTYPLGNKQFAIENGPVEIVDLPMKNGGSFHCFLYVYQNVSLFGNHVSIAVSWWKFLFQGHVQLGLKTLRSETHSNRIVCAVFPCFSMFFWE